MAKKTPISLKFDTDLLAKLDAFGATIPYDTTRTALIETAVRQMLEREGKPEGKRK